MKVLVYGDYMLDAWMHVSPIKISSEAPVMVVQQENLVKTPGGAGNSAMNCAALGADVHAIGIAGNDASSDELYALLTKAEINVDFFYVPGNLEYKARIVDERGNHILRIDSKTTTRAKASDMDVWFKRFEGWSESVLVSDYGKGCAEHLLSFWGRNPCFKVVNGKPENLGCYSHADVLVFNESEVTEVVGKRFQPAEALHRLASRIGCHLVMTVGERGLWWRDTVGNLTHVRAPVVHVADVAGAGDVISATIAVRGKIDSDVLTEAVQNAAKVVSERGTCLLYAAPSIEPS
jgi:D-beta-D-heptose 7-phosphate kinase/D-beta-D-heptose 1-phosphate adenosyltransferase